MIFKLALAISVLATGTFQAPTENYPNSVQLSPKYTLYWKYDANTITFETHVLAHGYTGFGFSETSSMFPGDVIVGYVDHNKAVFNDYHTTRHGPISLDASQDWTLLDSRETQDETMLKFSRALDTGDAANDIVIHPGNMHVIWSFTDVDPTGPNNITYHGERGVQDVRLFGDSVPVGK